MAISTVEGSVAESNGDAYIFVMPNTRDRYRILDQGPQQLGTSGSGKSVGVGAAFARPIPELRLVAGIGEEPKGRHRNTSDRAAGAQCADCRRLRHRPAVGSDYRRHRTSSSGTKDISIDAWAAVNLIYNKNLAYSPRAKVPTPGMDTVNTNGYMTRLLKLVNFYLHSWQKGETQAQSMAFPAANHRRRWARGCGEHPFSDWLRPHGNGTVSARPRYCPYLWRGHQQAIATAVGAISSAIWTNSQKVCRLREAATSPFVEYFNGSSSEKRGYL
jgi:hypothetical protein